MLKVKVKAAGVTNLTDARYFAAREVEWMGFPLETGISHIAAKAIKEWVDGVKFIGEFGFTPAGEIREAISSIELDAVQVGTFTTKEEMAILAGIPVIKEVVIEANTSRDKLLGHLVDYSSLCEFFLLDFEKSGITWQDLKEEKPFDLDFLKSVCSGNKVILNIGLSFETVDEILTTLQPYGLNIAGGVEEKVGLKSFDELDTIFDRLEISQ